MNQERTPAPSNNHQQSSQKTVGNYLSSIEEVPIEVRQFALNKLTPRNDIGEKLQDTHGNNITAKVATAKENGSYYGPVILNNDKYIVQAVGKDKLSAVVHDRKNIELKGQSLQALDEKKQMNGTNLQIHYSGDSAKAYHWNADKQREQAPQSHQRQSPSPAPEATPKEPAKPEITSADFMQKAQDYAKENIKNTNQREAFLKHLGNVTEQVYGKSQDTPQHADTPAKKAPEASTQKQPKSQTAEQDSGQER